MFLGTPFDRVGASAHILAFGTGAFDLSGYVRHVQGTTAKGLWEDSVAS